MIKGKSGNANIFKSKSLGISLILILGFLIRIFMLGEKSVYVDEAATLFLSLKPLPAIIPNMMLINEVHPPLYFWLMSIWLGLWRYLKFITSSYEFYMRFSSVIFGTASIYLTYLLGKKLFSIKTGLLAAFLISISAFHVYYSQEFRMYPLLVVLMMLSFYFFLILLEKPRPATAALFIASTAAALLTHYYAFYIIAVEISFLIYLKIISGRNLIKIISEFDNIEFAADKSVFNKRIFYAAISLIISIAAVSWWIPVFFRQTGFQNFTLRQNPGISDFFLLFSKIAFSDTFVHPVFHGFDLLILASIIPFFAVILAAAKNRTPGTVFALIWLFVPVFATFAVTFTRFHIFEFKYFFIVAPALWILVSSAFFVSKKRRISSIILLLVIAFNIYSNYNYQMNPFFQKQDWKGAAAFVKSRMKEGDRVILHPSMMAFPFILYFKNNNTLIPMDEPDPSRLLPEKGKSGGLWLVTSIYHPFVGQAGLLGYYKEHFGGKEVCEFGNFNPADVIRVYYGENKEEQGPAKTK